MRRVRADMEDARAAAVHRLCGSPTGRGRLHRKAPTVDAFPKRGRVMLGQRGLRRCVRDRQHRRRVVHRRLTGGLEGEG